MSSSESDDDESLMMMQDLVQLDDEVVYGRDRRALKFKPEVESLEPGTLERR